MGKINVGRVLLGGLVAGVVLNIGEFVLNSVLVAKDMEEDFRRLNVPEPGGDFIAKAVVLTFLVGILLVYLYAAIRPRFGAGVKTAVCAGLIGWFFTYVYMGTIYSTMLLSPMKILAISIVWGLVEYTAGAVAGAWLYKEEA